MKLNGKITIIEYRDSEGKLEDIWFDESPSYIKNRLNDYKKMGGKDFVVVQNPKKFDLSFVEDLNKLKGEK